jgi:hypothetical protein
VAPQNLALRAPSRYDLETVRFLQILLVALLFGVPTLRAQEASTSTGPLIAQSSESRLVWVNTATGIYHYSATRWYGKTKQGEFMSEEEARAKGYRLARNGQCQLDRLPVGSKPRTGQAGLGSAEGAEVNEQARAAL